MTTENRCQWCDGPGTYHLADGTRLCAGCAMAYVEIGMRHPERGAPA